MTIDDPIALSELLDTADIRDVVRSFAAVHDIAIAVVESPSRLLISTTSDGGQWREPLAGGADPKEALTTFDPTRFSVVSIMHHGATIGRLILARHRDRDGEPIREEELEGLGRHISHVFDILIHNAFARHVTSTVHTEAMAANFAELSAKNKRLEKAVERMQEAERLKSSFLATMSHELRTPLTSVIGYSEMLLEGLAGAINNEQREYLKTILAKADQLLQLITSILDVSMLESGEPPLKPEPLAIREIIDTVFAGLGEQLNAREVSVTEERPNLPRVLADSRQVREVLRQLLANALKFTDSGDRIAVELSVGPLQPDSVTPHGRPGIRIVVRDSGIGISIDQQRDIFEPFFQADSSSTRQYGGTGLGLTLAKRYVEAHGGRIWVDSKPGKGAAFTVALPAVDEEMRAFLGLNRPS